MTGLKEKPMRSFYKFVSTYLADTAMVVSPIIFWLAVLVLGSHFPQNSWFRYSTSTVTYAPYGWIIGKVFWLSGFTLMLMALRLGRIAGKDSIYKIGVTLIFLAVLVLLLSRLFLHKLMRH
jgi:hypothetical protein